MLHTESGLNWGGQEYRTLIEAQWLNGHDHSSWVACDPRSEMYRRGLERGDPVVPVSMRNNADPAGVAALFGLCRREKIDLVHTHGSKDSWMALALHWAGYPVVRSRHITVPIKPGFFHSFIYRHGCRRVIATAEIIRETLIRVNGLEPAKVDVVGEGVNFNEYHPFVDGTDFRREFGIPPESPLIGQIGMMRGDKGHHFVLDAAFEVLKDHPEARFVLVGEGVGGKRVERELRARIDQAGERERVIMTGYRWDIPKAIAACDIVVLASIEVEAQSRVVPQSFACRRAVIATRVGGIPELVTDGESGLLVPPGSGAAIAKAICSLIEQPELREKIAAGGYRVACRRLSLDRMMEATLAVYRTAISGGKQ